MRSPSLVLLVLILTACFAPTRSDSYAITGSIVAVDVSAPIGEPPTIHVKTSDTDECGVIFLVRPSTSIRRSLPGGGSVSVSASELTIGRRVEVTTTVVLDSCPGQSSARAIVILP